jgi:hypothetical protein
MKHRFLYKVIPILVVFALIFSLVPTNLIRAKAESSDVVQPDYTIYGSSNDISRQAMAIDSQNRVHIVYGGDMLYENIITDITQGQTTTVLDDTSGVGGNASIAIGPHDIAHIAYYDRINKDLKYFSPRTVVDSEGDVGSVLAIAVGTDNLTQIAYYDKTNNRIKLAKQTSIINNTWDIQAVANFTGSLKGIRLALDSQNNPVILYGYTVTSNGNTDYYTWIMEKTGATWSGTEVASSGIVFPLVDLKTKKDGTVCMMYYEWGSTGISGTGFNYSCLISGNWQNQVVGKNNDHVWDIYLQYDNAGNPHILYKSDGYFGHFYYDGSQWLFDPTGNQQQMQGFSFDSNNRLYYLFSYTYGDNYLTYYTALKNQSDWGIHYINLTQKWTLGSYPKYQLDSNDAPWILFADEDNSYNASLDLLHSTATGWVGEKVASDLSDYTGRMGFYDFGISPSGHVHIIYEKKSDDNAYYLQNVSGSWVTTQAPYCSDDVSLIVKGDTDVYLTCGINHQSINYYHWDGASWNSQVTNTNFKNLTYRFDVDSKGVAYFVGGSSDYDEITNTFSNYKTFYTTWDGTQWKDEVFNIVADSIYGFKLDNNGVPNILYKINNQVVLRRWTGTQWSDKVTPLIPYPQSQYYVTPFSFDSQNNIHIIGYSSTDQLAQITEDNDGWFASPLNLKGILSNIAVSFDKNDSTQLFYYDPGLTDIMYYALPKITGAALSLNHTIGAPGSYFTLHGINYPAGGTANVYLNNQLIGNGTIDENGEFTVILSTTDADEGHYVVRVDGVTNATALSTAQDSTIPSATIDLDIDSQAPIRAKEADAQILVVPSGIMNPKVYIPLVIR